MNQNNYEKVYIIRDEKGNPSVGLFFIAGKRVWCLITELDEQANIDMVEKKDALVTNQEK